MPDNPTPLNLDKSQDPYFPNAADEVADDRDEQAPMEADFAPLADEDESEGERAEIDPYQFDSIQAEEAFEAATVAAQEGDEEEAVQHYIRASKIAETAHE